MRVMIFVKATADSEAGLHSTPKEDFQNLMAEMGKFNDELIKAGIMKDGDGLKPTSHGKRVQFNCANRTVVDGPFSPADHQVAGFWIWDVKDMNEAIDWVKKCPNPMPGPSEIEIRPCYEEADFADFA